MQFPFLMNDGKEKITHPIFHLPIQLNGSVLIQPILFQDNSDSLEYKTSDYVKNIINFDNNGIGSVFIENSGQCGKYSSFNNLDWIPRRTYSDEYLINESAKGIIKYQISMVNQTQFGQISSMKREIIKAEIASAKHVSRIILNMIDN